MKDTVNTMLMILGLLVPKHFCREDSIRRGTLVWAGKLLLKWKKGATKYRREGHHVLEDYYKKELLHVRVGAIFRDRRYEINRKSYFEQGVYKEMKESLRLNKP